MYRLRRVRVLNLEFRVLTLDVSPAASTSFEFRVFSPVVERGWRPWVVRRQNVPFSLAEPMRFVDWIAAAGLLNFRASPFTRVASQMQCKGTKKTGPLQIKRRNRHAKRHAPVQRSCRCYSVTVLQFSKGYFVPWKKLLYLYIYLYIYKYRAIFWLLKYLFYNCNTVTGVTCRHIAHCL